MPILGRVKWFDTRKGFGFIEPDDHSEVVFVHYSDILDQGYRELRAGERVRFEITDSPKGKRAIQVERLPNEK